MLLKTKHTACRDAAYVRPNRLTIERMISRRLIRVKAFKELYSRVSTDSFAIQPAENELFVSCSKTKELYCQLLMLPYALAKVAEERLNLENAKFNPDHNEIIANSALRENGFSALVAADESFQKYCADHGISWTGYDVPLRALHTKVLGSEYFKTYAAIEEPSLKDAVSLFKNIYTESIEDFSPVCDALEQNCIWWGDDLGYVLNFLLNNIDSIARKGKVELPELFIKEDDMEFAKKLVGATLLNYDDYTELVAESMPRWDMERVVLSDMLLIVMGIAEAVSCPTIPLKVTINEYVEISKYYSTPKSSVFVNGLLNGILQKLSAEGRIKKSGRGLNGSLDAR